MSILEFFHMMHPHVSASSIITIYTPKLVRNCKRRDPARLRYGVVMCCHNVRSRLDMEIYIFRFWSELQIIADIKRRGNGRYQRVCGTRSVVAGSEAEYRF